MTRLSNSKWPDGGCRGFRFRSTHPNPSAATLEWVGGLNFLPESALGLDRCNTSLSLLRLPFPGEAGTSATNSGRTVRRTRWLAHQLAKSLYASHAVHQAHVCIATCPVTGPSSKENEFKNKP